MDLRSNNPYWLLRHGIKNVYPSLQKNDHADVTVMGGGITGAIMTHYLCKAGFSVNVVDKRHIGFGSTAASTGLLQYEIDTPLHELIKKVGEHHAVRSYQLCLEALDVLRKMASPVKHEVGYSEAPSLQYASYQSHLRNLSLEFKTRQKFNVGSIEWLESADIGKLFGIRSPGAIFSKEGAMIDAYATTHALIGKSIKQGSVKIYDGTMIEKIDYDKRKVTVTSNKGQKLTSRYLVIACGYESQRYLSKQVEISNSTYAIVSEPYERDLFWHKNAMIWETADPYLYIRKTDTNRLIIGGKDDEFYNPAKRDAKLSQKAVALEKAFRKLFPAINFTTDFRWAGYFGKTKDGLPYIGSVPERPNTYFALGFGGNGIVFSVIAAGLITDLLSGKKNKDLSIFSFLR